MHGALCAVQIRVQLSFPLVLLTVDTQNDAIDDCIAIRSVHVTAIETEEVAAR